ncbi:hypothetical protein SFRURICE_003663 [Spodoptera frugiperda]|nr:hypothetical protein SFRURICE_003663 [Spodoptera frugiperda]
MPERSAKSGTMWLKPKICRKSLFHTNEVAGYNKSVEGSILFIENIEKINSTVLLVTQNGEIKLPREDRHPRGRSRGQKLVMNISLHRILAYHWPRLFSQPFT